MALFGRWKLGGPERTIVCGRYNYVESTRSSVIALPEVATFNILGPEGRWYGLK
jgi:hypothetical protein